MASKTISLSLSLLIFFVCADGRSLQKNYADESINLSHGFSLQATNNAGKTNDNDVLGLSAITTEYNYLKVNNGDPCRPTAWSWIECSSDPRPRILALNLRNLVLAGVIPDFSSMDALQRIDLSMNLFSGSIPSFLGTFPDLERLDLSSNLYLRGLIPDSLTCKKNKKLIFIIDYPSSNLYVSNNCSTWNNSPSPSTDKTPDITVPVPATSSTKKKSSLPAILGGTISSFGVFWIALGIFMLYRHKNKTAAAIAQTSVAMS